MTDHDPEVQRAIDTAAHELARRLRPWATAMADPDAFAAAFIEDLHAEGWRPIPKPLPLAGPGRKDPDAYARGGEYARDLLANRPTGPYRPTEGDPDA
jgi:hypothetical protein